MRHLSLGEVLELHAMVARESGRPAMVRDLAALGTAVAEPRRTLARKEVHVTVDEKAAALVCALLAVEPFKHCNRSTAHAALETFLLLNGQELHGRPGEAEENIAGVAARTRSREGLMAWIRERIGPPERGR